MSRPPPPPPSGPPPDCDWKLTRASAIADSRGARLRSISIEVRLRSSASVRLSVALPTLTRSTTCSTSGAVSTILRAWVATASACARVDPGARKMRTWLNWRSCGGMKVKLNWLNSSPVRTSEASPPTTDDQRCFSVHCSARRYQRITALSPCGAGPWPLSR